MGEIAIETYKVSSHLSRFPTSRRHERGLEMTGPVLFHGIQNRVVFGFNSQWDDWDEGVAGYLSSTSSGLVLGGWFGLSEFEYYYDLVRSERPIHAQYDYVSGHTGSGSGYCRRVGLGTSDEVIGEGPADSTSSLALLLSAGGILPAGPPAGISVEQLLLDAPGDETPAEAG